MATQPPKAFRDFFLSELPDLQAELRRHVDTCLTKWLASDEFKAVHEQTRQHWLRAGIDIDQHRDALGRLRLLVAKASPQLLPDTFRDGTWFQDSPPSEWFAALYEAACQSLAVADHNTHETATPTWSNYRTPQEWRTLRAGVGLSASESTWRNLRKDHPGDIQGEPGREKHMVRLSQKLATAWGLKLAEFDQQ